MDYDNVFEKTFRDFDSIFEAEVPVRRFRQTPRLPLQQALAVAAREYENAESAMLVTSMPGQITQKIKRCDKSGEAAPSNR
jgi:hypothetical protein